MPKRKYVRQDDYDKLFKRIEQLEENLQHEKRRRTRLRVESSSSSDSDDDSLSGSSHDGSATRQADTGDIMRATTELSPPSSPLAAAATPSATAATSAAAVAPAVADATVAEAAAPSLSTADPTDVSVVAVLPPISSDEVTELDADILEILGIDPTKTDKFGKDIQKDLAVRLEHIATAGLSKEERKDLTSRYLLPENCKIIGAPSLNPEIKAALSESVIKRDVVIEGKQKLLASAISSLGEAISIAMAAKEKNTESLRLLMDTARILCDCQHHETNIRRNFIIFSVKKDMKESLQNTKIDNCLFGNNLGDTLKAAKAINKQGAELKAPANNPRPSTSKTNLPQSKNWKSQGRASQARPSAPPPKTRASKSTAAPAASREPRSTSSRRSQYRGPPARR